MTKVGKSDGEGTFPGRRGNDKVAPIAVIDCRRASDCSRPKPDMTGSAYSITSSARARINGGIVRPSALAVLRLMMSLNVVGCSIGRSAG
jgi:hypothetical protein